MYTRAKIYIFSSIYLGKYTTISTSYVKSTYKLRVYIIKLVFIINFLEW